MIHHSADGVEPETMQYLQDTQKAVKQKIGWEIAANIVALV